jgi:hypothetical protein
MIRDFTLSDLPNAVEVFQQNGLPANCFPPLYIDVNGVLEENKLFVEKQIMMQDGEPVMSCFLKITAEIYLVLDHTKGTPEERLEWLTEMRDEMAVRAATKGLDQVTCWIPPDLEKSFGPRLVDLGFQKSWQSYTFNL